MRCMIALAAALTGCGIQAELPQTEDRRSPRIDDALWPAVQAYLEAAPDRGEARALREVALVQGFGSDTTKVGECLITTTGWRTELWVRISVDVPDGILRAVTTWHELGHCLHGLAHVDDADAIMNPYIRWDAGYWMAEGHAKLTEMFDTLGRGGE